ncbi:hypothetical protein [Brevibacillus laterosporus]|uniref:hypothetical protein n=1 Tax=Brevibacillus laterosporus TaxID=1465 RepID=UPI000E6B4EB5|nr:hypothetical protein [Brevibacillus laterosporus]AYB37554.1 hypothetical protein D5F52_04260 [Brevibacillus laterosporus]MBM7111346.1 hypothetical protein [Brevibacillus laterosporus]
MTHTDKVKQLIVKRLENENYLNIEFIEKSDLAYYFEVDLLDQCLSLKIMIDNELPIKEWEMWKLPEGKIKWELITDECN